jgi:hypothetical protein
MTSFTKSLMLAAAACAIAAGNAAAQTYHAEIPFTFRAGTTVMAPGSYEIVVASNLGSKHIRVRDLDTRKTIMVQWASITGDQKHFDGPKLSFECVNTRCALATMWVGGYEGAYKFHTPALEKNETARIETVGLAPAKAD